MMMDGFIRKHFIYPDGRKEWAVTGEFGSLSFWATPIGDENREIFGGEEFYGGVETHYNEKSKPDYLGDTSKHDSCQCNGGQCWHDGTSLWASEYWIPHILPHGDEFIWRTLEMNYNLKPEDAEV